MSDTDSDEEIIPASGGYSAGFIVMDSQAESQDNNDVMQCLPALNQAFTSEDPSSSFHQLLMPEDKSVEEDKMNKFPVLATDSEFEPPTKKDINTSSDDVVSESEDQGEITVIEKQGQVSSGLQSSPSDHIGCLQLSSKPMLVPDTVDESSPSELPPSPNAYHPHIIPSSPTDGSFQEIQTKDHLDESVVEIPSSVIKIDNESMEVISINSTPEKDFHESQHYSLHLSPSQSELTQRSCQDYSSQRLSLGKDEIVKDLQSQNDNSNQYEKNQRNSGMRFGMGSEVKSSQEYKLIGNKDGMEQSPSQTDKQHSQSEHISQKQNELLSKCTEGCHESQESRRKLQQTSGESLMTPPHLVQNPSEFVRNSSQSVQNPLILEKNSKEMVSPSQSHKYASQVVKDPSQTAKDPSQTAKDPSQSIKNLSQTARNLSQPVKTPSPPVKGPSEAVTDATQPVKVSSQQTKDPPSIVMDPQQLVQNSDSNSNATLRLTPSLNPDFIIQSSQAVSKVTSKTYHQGDSQEPGPSHAVTPPTAVSTRPAICHRPTSVDSPAEDDEPEESYDLSFTLERPEIQSGARSGMSEDSCSNVFKRTSHKDQRRPSRAIITEEGDDIQINKKQQAKMGSIDDQSLLEVTIETDKAANQERERSVYSQPTQYSCPENQEPSCIPLSEQAMPVEEGQQTLQKVISVSSEESQSLALRKISSLLSDADGQQPTLHKVISVSSEVDGQQPTLHKVISISSDTGYRASVEESVSLIEKTQECEAVTSNINDDDTEIYDPIAVTVSKQDVEKNSEGSSQNKNQHISSEMSGSKQLSPSRLTKRTTEEIRDWLTQKPTFTDKTFKEKNVNTYSGLKPRTTMKKRSLTQDNPEMSVTREENVITGNFDPYTFHGTQSQDAFSTKHVLSETTHDKTASRRRHTPIQDTPVSSKKKRQVFRRKGTMQRKKSISRVTFSDQVQDSTNVDTPKRNIYTTTSTSSEKSSKGSFQSPENVVPTPPSVPITHGDVKGTSKTTPRSAQLGTPSSSQSPVDLTWVFTPSPDMGELCRLIDSSNVKHKQSILSQMGNVKIVNQVKITGTMVKYFTVEETYQRGIRKQYAVKENEDREEVKTDFHVELIPPEGYISPSRSTSTVTSGDLGDISSFSSGSVKSNLERSGSSSETSSMAINTGVACNQNVDVPPVTSPSTMITVHSTQPPCSASGSIQNRKAKTGFEVAVANMKNSDVATGAGSEVIALAPSIGVISEYDKVILSTPTEQMQTDIIMRSPRERDDKGSLPSSEEIDPSPLEASTINKTGSRLNISDDTHSSDLFYASPDTSASEKKSKDSTKRKSDTDKDPTEVSLENSGPERGRRSRKEVRELRSLSGSNREQIAPRNSKPATKQNKESTSSSDKMSPAVPYQDMQTIEASSEEMGSGMIYSKPEIGSRVIAKWKDRFFYPGVISRVDKARFQVKFDDGDILFIRPGDILLINRLPIGQPVMVPTGPESYYEGGLIVGHVRQGGTILYSVEQDAGNREAFRMSQVILSEDQAKCLVSDTNCLVSTTHPNVSDVKMSDVTLDNLMEGKRRTGSRYAQKDIGSPNIKSWKEKESKNSHKETESKTENVPATAKSSKKRKYTIDVPPSATSTPTPNRAKRHKGDDFDTTPHLGYSQDSPIVPLTRRSPRKSRVGLFETSSSKIFEGMLFLITYVEKSQEDKSAEKEFLRDSSLSNDESASESTDDTVLLNKALLRQKIEMAGGTFLPNFEESKIQAAKHCFLISDTYQRTIKYFQCLAAAIPCVSHLWIHHSIAQSKVLDYRSYMLQAGISIEKKKVMEWNCRRGALMGLKVLIISTDLQYKQQWLSILNAAGCETVNKLPRTGAGDVNLVLADKSITESSLRRIRSLDLPIVGTEWVIQSLIMGTRVEFSGHPKYQYDAV